MKAILYPATGFIAALFTLLSVHAQLPYSQSFKNSSASGVTFSGNAKLTAATGTDVEGDGYLRLTDNTTNQVGYVYAKEAFPSNYGLTTTFEFFTYKTTANGFNQADGICFFLFDASVNAFRPGGLGGSLGYAEYYGTPGMTKGYLGIGIDEYGNYSNPTEGRTGGPGKTIGSVVVRGPGNGKSATDYVYITGVQTSLPAYSIPITNFTQRYPDYTTPNYRRIKIILTPGSSLGTDKGFTITVTMFKGGTPGTEVTLINNFDYPYLSPSKLQYGFAASTGSNTDFHEIRNLNILPTITTSFAAPTVNNDNVSVCQGPQALLDVTANDVSNNSGGTINKASVDLDPVTAGIQTTLTDPGKGTYTVDQNGIVTFTPVSGFVGNSVINYTVSDTYGILSPAATISVTISSSLGPSLTMGTPSGACAPQVVDITNATLRSNTTTGATYDYFSNLTDANNNVNNITSTANSINTTGIYYVRANSGVCYNVQPVTVVVSQIPTVANGGSSLNLCSASSATFAANDPAVGIGTWSQLTGPSTASITSPAFSNTGVTNLQKGTYTFRWSIANGACTASNSDITVKVVNAASTGSNQTLSNTATSTTLQGNDPTPGTGVWSQVSGPSASITATTNPTSTVTGLTAGSSYVFKWTVSNGSCSTNSQTTINVTSVLPVRFISFTGTRQNDKVVLNWQTASEKDNDHFVVERSMDGVSFNAIGLVAGAGASSTTSYAYRDEIKSIAGSAIYYRLQQVDKDGQSSYSSIVKINLDASQSKMEVWPNPFKESIHLNLFFTTPGKAIVRLYDNTGRLVKQQEQIVMQGQNSFSVDHLEKTAKGIFVIEVEKGGEKQQQKIIRE